jgi:hypothetical protein
MSDLLKTQAPSHAMFADECGYNCGRYRAVAVVSATSARAHTVADGIARFLQMRNIKEMKWEFVRTDHKRKAAVWIIRYIFDECLKGEFRIDVLGWDTQDSRHKVRGRDDVINLEKMYYHLCRNLMGSRWQRDAVWHLYPDENSALNWDVVKDTLYHKSLEYGGLQPAVRSSERTAPGHILTFRKNYTIAGITPVDSEMYPLVQVADLFAGIMVYSKNGADAYDRWRIRYKAEMAKTVNAETPTLTGSERARSAVLNMLVQWIQKQPELGYGLDRQKGIYTSDPRCPVNFWWYRPQHPTDKAPTKS